MKIDDKIRTIKIKDLFEGYKKLSEIDEDEEVLAWKGNLIVVNVMEFVIKNLILDL